ncbi:cationic amino acid transporter 3-like [Aplysia californica]|uniref:Cationic amino acid transporter 3-like n=1 Tax=Aplysia californica TaxID=6500 RepID=A0ABM0KAU7_APLCA|nr:cationic amino acid transporter 3-like [Aplysia californica]
MSVVQDVEVEGQMFTSDPDFFPCCLVIAAIFLSFITIKRYAMVTFALTSLSGLVVLAFICVGFFHVDSINWNSPPGFFAHGFSGIMSGAALIMSTFVSVDNLASCAEEARTPCKSLPTAFGFSLALLFTILFLVSSALTLASPWQQLADNAAIARAYETKGIFAAHYVIGVGAVLGLLPVVIGSFLHPVRLLFSMSQDRLLPGFLSKVGYNGIPVAPHFLTGAAIALSSLVLEFRTLLEMSSISTLVQFVSSSIILLFIRYQPATVGICREYSDLDLPNSMVAEDGLDIKDGLEFSETRPPKLVLLTTGDCKVPSEEKQYYSPIGDSPILSRSPIVKKVSNNNMGKPHSPGIMNVVSHNPTHGSEPAEKALNNNRPNSQTSVMSPSPAVSSSITFINRFKPPHPTSKGENMTSGLDVYSEKDSLFSSYNAHPIMSSSSGVYGGRGSTAPSDLVAVLNKDNKCFTGLRDRTQALNGVGGGGGVGTARSLASSVSSSLVAISPSVTLHADEHSWRQTRYFLLVYILASTCLAATCEAWPSDNDGAWWAVTLLCVSLALMLVSALCVARQPQNSAPLYFKAPYVPLVPLLAITCDMLLIAALPFVSWARFAMWIFPGLVIYVCYSHRHSVHRSSDDQEVVLFDISQLPSGHN